MDPFTPTHTITLDSESFPVQLVDDGAAYTADEWASETPAEYERQDDGSWTFQGQAFNGSVKTDDTTSPASEFFADGRDWCPTAQQQGKRDLECEATFAEEQAESADNDDDEGRGWDYATGSPWPDCPNCGTTPVEGKYPGGCSQCLPDEAE